MTVNSKNTKAIKTPAEFQTAIAETKFGLYNILLLIIIIPAALTIQFESTLTSYIVPAAVCDLKLDLTQKSLLNSMPFFGMVSTGLFCGFLLDTLGRKKMLLVGLSVESFIIIAKCLSPNFTMLSVFTYIAGAVTGSLYVALTTYALEFHSNEYRGNIQMVSGMMYAFGNILIPMLAAVILPLNFKARLYFTDFHPWNLLIGISASYSIVSMIAFYFLPETPKFLMSIGKNEEALEIFRKMYRMNTGNPKENYPIEVLVDEINHKEEIAASTKTWREYFKAGGQQIRPLFTKTHRTKLLLVCAVQSTFQMGINTFRLYLPQIFQATHEYEVAHNHTSSNLCSILAVSRAQHGTDEEVVCTVSFENNLQVYFNSAIVACVLLVGYVIAGTLINVFGKKRLLGVLGVAASLAISCVYFSPNTTTTLILGSLYLATAGICFDIFVTVIVVIFPTTLRAMAISICLNMGRSLTVVGNMLLPILIEVGCAPPFIFLGCLILFAVLLTCTIPDTDNEDMK